MEEQLLTSANEIRDPKYYKWGTPKPTLRTDLASNTLWSSRSRHTAQNTKRLWTRLTQAAHCKAWHREDRIQSKGTESSISAFLFLPISNPNLSSQPRYQDTLYLSLNRYLSVSACNGHESHTRDMMFLYDNLATQYVMPGLRDARCNCSICFPLNISRCSRDGLHGEQYTCLGFHMNTISTGFWKCVKFIWSR